MKQVKQLSLAMALLVWAITSARSADTAPDMLIWCGLDYSKVKMIGTRDFRQPNEIFPGMLIKWNELFLEEMVPKLEKMGRIVRTDLEGVQALNAKATPRQIEAKDGTRSEMVDASDISAADIEKQVKSYKLTKKTGVGLVFIVDRLVKLQETGCIYVVFFDVASRRVLLSERFCEKAGGFGFRNYWFRPIKTIVETLKVARMNQNVPAPK